MRLAVHLSSLKRNAYPSFSLQTHTRPSTKGDPGDDSVNACIPTDPAKCKYAAFSNFLLAIDILVSSGVQVDTIHDDFSDYYEMFALGEFDKWYSAQDQGPPPRAPPSSAQHAVGGCEPWPAGRVDDN
eukprot:COSAG02_NODE_153_length_33128_cov_10.471253_8_plen_128_part_00